VLLICCAEGASSTTHVAERLAMDRTTVTRAIDRLVAAELVIREPRQRVVVRVSPTAAGNRAAERIAERMAIALGRSASGKPSASS
jgi:DNA-binding MarR family transcriptional regulator